MIPNSTSGNSRTDHKDLHTPLVVKPAPKDKVSKNPPLTKTQKVWMLAGCVLGAQAMELQGWMGMCILYDTYHVQTWSSPFLGDSFLVASAFANMIGKWALLLFITKGILAFKSIPNGAHALATRPKSAWNDLKNNKLKYSWRAFIMLSSALLFTYINAVAIAPKGTGGTIDHAIKMGNASARYEWVPTYLQSQAWLSVKYRGVISTFFFNFITGMGVADGSPKAIRQLWLHLWYREEKYASIGHAEVVTRSSKISAWCTLLLFIGFAGVVGWSNFLTLPKVGSDAMATNKNMGSLSAFFSAINPTLFDVNILGLNGAISLWGVCGYIYMVTLSASFTFDPVIKAVKRIRRFDPELVYRHLPVSIGVSVLGYLAASAVATQVKLAGQQPLGLYETASILGSISLEVPAFFMVFLSATYYCCSNARSDASQPVVTPHATASP